MNIETPDFMPVLSRGAHAAPDQGACIMEFASFLAGEEWTDHPKCVNSTLAAIARGINDRLSNDERQELLPLLPRLMGTTALDFEESKRLVRVIGPTEGGAEEVNLYALRYYASTSIGYLPNDALIPTLTRLLDEYDAITGRGAQPPLSTEDLARCAELIRA